jgi:hypothetical protein
MTALDPGRSLKRTEIGVTEMIIRPLMLVALATSCAGCAGFAINLPQTHEIKNPVPFREKQIFGDKDDFDRWACQPDFWSSTPLTKSDFLQAWGAPREKVIAPKGETWIYAESNRWCGLWLVVILPVPLVLPVCDTYDKVSFEGELAVSSVSHRIPWFGMGAVFIPPIAAGAAMSRPGRVTENSAQVGSLFKPGGSHGDLTCAP